MQTGPTQPRRATIEGTIFELVPWSLADGRRWLFRIAKLLAPMLTSGTAKGDTQAERVAIAGALVAALEQLDEATFLDFADTCERYTRIVGVDASGHETLTELTTVRVVFMQGKYFELVELMRAHLQAQYADFFGRLVRQLAALSATEAK